MTCTQFELLSRIPIAGLRLRLCRRHLDRCQGCRQVSDRAESLPSLLVTADRLPAGLDLWPGVKQGIETLQSPAVRFGVIPLSPSLKSWRWAYVAAMVVLLLIAGFWIIFHERHSQPAPDAYRPAVQTRLCSVKVGDRPARVFQVQSRNPDRSIFWIAKDNSRS